MAMTWSTVSSKCRGPDEPIAASRGGEESRVVMRKRPVEAQKERRPRLDTAYTAMEPRT